MNFPGPINSNLASAAAVAVDGETFSIIPKPFTDTGADAARVIVVPDPELLFTGNYARSGNDLVLSGPHQKYVVHDYFRGEKRPTLASKDGAIITGDVVSALAGHVQYAQAASAAPAEIVGHVMKLTGSASVMRNGVSVVLNVGDSLQKGDIVQTGTDSSLAVTLIDGTAFAMTSNARMVLTEMVYDPNGSSNSSLLNIVQGTISFVAGQTAKNGNMRIDTPVATMGIRGTAWVAEVDVNLGTSKFQLLVEPDGHTGSFNIYDKTTGQLIGTVSQAGYVTLVSPNGIGQQATAIETLKTGADDKTVVNIIQDVFKLYFPNYNPDPNPKSTDHPRTDIGVPGNTITKTGFTDVGRPTVTTTTTYTNPDTHQTTTVQITYVNTPPSFAVTNVLDAQAPQVNPTPGPHSFYLGDKVTITDPDIGAAPFLDVAVPYLPGTGSFDAQTSITTVTFGAYLTDPLRISLDTATGLVTYDPEAFRFLGVGETAKYTFNFTAASGVGSSQSDKGYLTLTLTVTGSNDAPTIAAGSHVADGVKEDTLAVNDKISTDGVITFQDFDLTDGHSAAISSTVPSSYIGVFSIQQPSEDLHDTGNTGTVSWHFEIPNESTNATLQSLGEGQTLTQQYTVRITDRLGVSVDQVVTITITGTNDAPLLNADTVPSHYTTGELTDVTGDTTADTASGTLSFTDVDLTDTHTVSAALGAGASAIVWSGHPTADLSALRATLLNKLTASIAPNNDSTNVAGHTGTVTWDFSADDDLFDFLGKNETLTLKYEITIQDNASGVASASETSTQTVTIVIGAANDRPVILDTSTLAKTDAENPSDTGDATAHIITGTVNYSDADVIDTHSIGIVDDAVHHTNAVAVWTDIHGTTHAITDPAIIDPTHLTFGTVDQAGNSVGWTYSVADNALDFLAAGETLVVTYDVAVQDDSGTPNNTSVAKQIKVTITGANDAPVITVASPAAVTEGNTGTPDLVTVAVTDYVTIADVDTTDVRTKYAGDLAFDNTSTGPAPPTGSLASLFTLNTTIGTIQYDKAAFDYLAEGDQVVASFTFHASSGPDTQLKTITITINGQNDAPVVSAALTATANEGDGPQNLNLLANASDVDRGETATLAVVGSSVLYAVDRGTASATAPAGLSLIGSTLTVDSTNAAFDHLAGGTPQTIVVTYDVEDVHHAVVHQSETITITGTNDAPVVSGAVSAPSVFEDGQLSTLNALANASDVDDGTVLSVVGVPTTLPAGVTYNAATQSFTLDPTNAAYQHLATGASTVVTVNYGVTDGAVTTPTAASVSWTITGTNDAPVLTANAVLPSASEDSGGTAQTLSSLFAGSVQDADDAAYVKGFAISDSGVSSNGAWWFSDNGGVWSPIGTTSASTALIVAASVLVKFVPSQDFNGNPPPLTVYAIDDTYLGYFSSGSGGTRYTVDLTQAYTHGDTAPISQNGATISTTITPVNDAPVVDLDSAAAGTTATLEYSENDPATPIAPSATVTDVDSPNFDQGSLSVSFTTAVHSEDQLSVVPDGLVSQSGNDVYVGGTLVGTLDQNHTGSNGDYLKINFNVNATQAAVTTLMQHIGYSNNSDNPDSSARTVEFKVADGDGTANSGADTAQVNATINVTPVNDAPIAANNLLALTEDTPHVFTSSDFAFGDTDGNSLLAVKVVTIPAASSGTLSLNGNAVSAGTFVNVADIVAGNLVFTPAADVNGNDLQGFSFQVQDDGGVANGGQDLSGTYAFTFNVTPVNDAPVITSNGGLSTTAISITENSTAVTTVTATDVDALDGKTFSIVNTAGTDYAKFAINAGGTLTFVTAPNFETPTDVGGTPGDNIYVVDVKVTDDSGASDTQRISVTVQDGPDGAVLTNPASVTNGNFGYSVAMGADGKAIVGAWGNGTSLAGKVYVYNSDSMHANTTPDVTLAAADAANNDNFGVSVAVNSSGVLAVGSYKDDDTATDSGSVYIYSPDGSGGYNAPIKLHASTPGTTDLFGKSVAVGSDGTVVVGSYLDNVGAVTDAGSLSVFKPNGSGGYLSPILLTAPDAVASDQLGWSVKIASDGTIAAGAYFHDVSSFADAGAVYIYKPNGSGGYNAPIELTAPDAAASDGFGFDMAFGPDGTIAVGSFQDDDNSTTDSGSVYIYHPDGSGGYSYAYKLTSPSPLAAGGFGVALAFNSSGTLVVSENGSGAGDIYVYQPNGSGGFTTPIKIAPSDGVSGDYFGRSVSINDSGAIVVGAPRHDDSSTDAGKAYVYLPDGHGGYVGQDGSVYTANHAPALSTEGIHVSATSSPNTTTFSGLSVSDADSGDTYTINASVGHGTLTDAAGASLPNASLSLSSMNSLLATGIKYTPNTSVGTDKLTLTITDNHASSDTVNFIFNIDAATANPVTLTGTTGKDYLFATSAADTFVFSNNSNKDVIAGGFEAGTDKIDLQAVTNIDAAALTSILSGADHLGADTLLHLNANIDTLLVKGVGTLAASDFIIHT